MKFFPNLIILSVIFVSACTHAMTRDVFDGEKPQICVEAFDTPPSIYADSNKLARYSVDELITLNFCGKEYTSQMNLNLQIINHQNYPVPILLNRLEQESRDEFRFYIIETLGNTPEYKLDSYKFEEQFRADRARILTAVGEAISKMQDGEFKKSAVRKKVLLENYFGEKSLSFYSPAFQSRAASN